MNTRSIGLAAGWLSVLTLGLLLPVTASAQTAPSQYTAAKTRDDAVRKEIAATPASAPIAKRTEVVTKARAVIGTYEMLVRRFRASGYSDNALYNAATLAEALHGQFALTTDLDSAVRLYKRLNAEYPTAPLAKDAAAALIRLAPTVEAAAPAPLASASARESSSRERRQDAAEPASSREGATTAAPPAADGRAKLTAIDRTVLPELVRVTLSLDREVGYREETLAGPARVFFDFKGVEAAKPLTDAVLRYSTDVVRLIRIGRHPNAIRVVLDLEGVRRHSVYTLYNPFRIVIDAEPQVSVAAAAAPPLKVEEAPPVVMSMVPTPAATSSPVVAAASAPASASRSAPVAPVASVAPVAPVPAPLPAPVSPNTVGGFSMSRQLGLGISRIVIDPGHGGHDPGAQARGLNEADLTLDIALKLEKLLQDEPGLEVVLTRRSDVYIPLEERTAIANREGADLFLSIHANTSRNTSARGVESYFLSFAGSPDAEAVAARENASHAGDMHTLPDIIKAITLNNKLDESRDFARMVQEALVSRLRRSDKTLPNRGVKKAPFVVLIGAEMPSVLAEVSFMSNRQELQLLKTNAYKQRVAEALQAAVMRYRRSLKGTTAVATASDKR